MKRLSTAATASSVSRKRRFIKNQPLPPHNPYIQHHDEWLQVIRLADESDDFLGSFNKCVIEFVPRIEYCIRVADYLHELYLFCNEGRAVELGIPFEKLRESLFSVEKECSKLLLVSTVDNLPNCQKKVPPQELVQNYPQLSLLGLLYCNGSCGVELNLTKANQIFTTLANYSDNFPKSLYFLAVCLSKNDDEGNDDEDNDDFDKIIELLEEGCSLKDPDAMCEYGARCYSDEYENESNSQSGEESDFDNDFEQDVVQAKKYLKSAAKHNIPRALCGLAEIKLGEVDDNIPAGDKLTLEKFEKIERLLKRSAEQGYRKALGILIDFYKDRNEMKYESQYHYYLEKAGRFHNPEYIHMLAESYSRVDDDEEQKINLSKAIEHYKRAANLGHPKSKFALGVLYFYGAKGIPQDKLKAIQLIEQASEDFSNAQLSMQFVYKNGIPNCFERDLSKVIKENEHTVRVSDYLSEKYIEPLDVKLTQQQQESFLFPTEIWMDILSFLVGDINVDVSKIPVHDLEYEKRPCSPLIPTAQYFVIPIENVIALLNLSVSSKQIGQMLKQTAAAGSESMTLFEFYWLKSYNFYAKLFYHFKTRDMEILSSIHDEDDDWERKAKIQMLSQFYERGKLTESLNDMVDEVLMSNIEDFVQTNQSKFVSEILALYKSKEEASIHYRKKLKQLEISNVDYCDHFRQDTSSFELFMYQAKLIALEVFNHLDSDYDYDCTGKNLSPLIHEHHVEYLGSDRDEWLSNKFWSEIDPTIKCKVFDLDELGWRRLMHPNPFELDNIPSSMIDEEEPVGIDQLKLLDSRLKQVIGLNFTDLPSISPLKTYTFPSNIEFINIQDFISMNLEGLYFPGVKVLRYCNYSGDRKDKLQDVAKSVSCLLNKKCLPQLRYLIFAGLDTETVLPILKNNIDFLKQVINIEIYQGLMYEIIGPKDLEMFNNSSSNLRFITVSNSHYARYNSRDRGVDLQSFYEAPWRFVFSVGRNAFKM